jgi:hypothetical protein
MARAVFLPRQKWKPRPQGPQHATGRLPVGALNKLEQAYAAHLEEEKRADRVLWYAFGAIKLRLADNTFYSPDFAVLSADGVLEMHEVKGGFWEEDARVKIKVAASLFPFRFRAMKRCAQKHGGGWQVEDFERKDSRERAPALPGL